MSRREDEEEVLSPRCDFYKALNKAQSEFPTIIMDQTALVGKYSYQYASLGNIIDTTKPALTKNGLSIMFSMNPRLGTEPGVDIICMLSHISGYFETSTINVIQDENPQRLGSMITYMRRYLMCSILNIVAEKDTDAQDIARPEQAKMHPADLSLISEAQRERLFTVCSELGINKDKSKEVIKKYGFESSKDITKKFYEKIVNDIKRLGDQPA